VNYSMMHGSTNIKSTKKRFPFLTSVCITDTICIRQNKGETTVDIKKVGGILVKTTDEYIQEILPYHH